jgi:hypothetical protein
MTQHLNIFQTVFGAVLNQHSSVRSKFLLQVTSPVIQQLQRKEALILLNLN